MLRSELEGYVVGRAAFDQLCDECPILDLSTLKQRLLAAQEIAHCVRRYYEQDQPLAEVQSQSEKVITRPRTMTAFRKCLDNQVNPIKPFCFHG